MRRVAAFLALVAWSGLAFAQPRSPHEELTLETYRELIEINTVHPNGDNTAAARAMAKRLLDAGFDAKDVQVYEPAPRKGNLVARYRGTGELRPLLLLAHIDVVDAKKEDWSDGLDNALPQRARAVVNCRLLPGDKQEAIENELRRVAGPRVTVTAQNRITVSEASDPESAPMKTIQRVSETMWPGIPVVPVMSTGATDGLQLRNAGIPVYGTNGILVEHGEIRIHGRDERVAVRSFYDGAEFLYRLVRAFAAGE